MKDSKRLLLRCASVAMLIAILQAVIFLSPEITLAQKDWKPERPSRLIIQYAAGGGTDLNMRTLAKGMEEVLRKSINCMNMAGALGSVAAKYVYDQPSDGYTWMGAGDYNPYHRILGMTNLAAWREWQYFQAAVSIASYAVLPDSPLKSFEDFIKEAKAKPGTIRVSTDGKSGMWAEGISIIGELAGFTFRNVPYDGGAPATMALLQREVDLAASGLHEQVEFLKAGKLRCLAVFADTDVEVPGLGVIKSITKIVPGTKDFAPFGGVYNIVLKRDTPKPIMMAVKNALVHATNTPAYQGLLQKRFFKRQLVFGGEVDKKTAIRECAAAWLYKNWGIAKKSPEELGLPRLQDFEKWWPPKDYKLSVVD